MGKALKKAFGQREKGQEGVLSYEIISARESPLLKLRMRVGGRNNVLHFFPALSKNYRSLRDIEEDSLGVGKQGIYGDFKKIGDRDLGLEVEEIKWIVDQIVRGAEQNEAVVRSCGIIPSVVDIVNRKGVGVRGGVEAEQSRVLVWEASNWNNFLGRNLPMGSFHSTGAGINGRRKE